MTLTELKSLKGEQLRILVAEAEGWKYSPLERMGNIIPRWTDGGVNLPLPPPYHESRDAITEAIIRRFTTEAEMTRFSESLGDLVERQEGDCYSSILLCLFRHATASAEDLCRAYLASL